MTVSAPHTRRQPAFRPIRLWLEGIAQVYSHLQGLDPTCSWGEHWIDPGQVGRLAYMVMNKSSYDAPYMDHMLVCRHIRRT